jgi:hypothetical protein
MIFNASAPTTPNVLILAIVGHLIGDYLFQTDWMALNKKARDLPCCVHCLIWSTTVCWMAGWIGWDKSILPQLILFITHFIQDRTQIVKWWMGLPWKDQSEFMKPPMAPWSFIVVDNVWHIVTIWLVWRFVA